MTRRLTGVLLVVLLGLSLVATPVHAVEGASEAEAEEGPPPGIDEIGTQNDVAREYFPEAYAEPTVFPPIKYALIALAILFAAALALSYVRWLPRFAQERARRKAGSRR